MGRPRRAARVAAASLLVLAGASVHAQGFQFSHPVLKERGIPVSEYQAIGRTHDAECQARALELASRRYPGTANPLFDNTPEQAERDRARGALVQDEYVKCMEGKGWVRFPR